MKRPYILAVAVFGSGGRSLYRGKNWKGLKQLNGGSWKGKEFDKRFEVWPAGEDSGTGSGNRQRVKLQGVSAWQFCLSSAGGVYFQAWPWRVPWLANVPGQMLKQV